MFLSENCHPATSSNFHGLRMGKVVCLFTHNTEHIQAKEFEILKAMAYLSAVQ